MESYDLTVGGEYEHEEYGYIVIVAITDEFRGGDVSAEVENGNVESMVAEDSVSYVYFDNMHGVPFEEASYKQPLPEFVKQLE